ncbi:hypothetical protein [Zunongwangia sp. HGR-M22]|uniref:hypothetical protein n=1 Tax=Zunongwangia sp. HGR-M22 TaxID=3015168 RepID=UPI0022DDB705|nr:hypothetical protein [Zunongwangia sp. HGR-M22]WBL26017.1 hypothetical protein PBT91_01690 [Zunongwangia sp. HGR-M22]
MTKKQITVTVISLIIVAVVISSFFANSFVEKKAISLLQKELPELQFDDLNINIFQNQANLSRISIRKGNVDLKSNEINVTGLDYWKFLISGDVEISSIAILDPEVIYFSKSKSAESSKKSKGSDDKSKDFKKEITVNSFNIKKGSFKILDSIQERTLLINTFDFELNEIFLCSATIANKIPFKYGGFNLKLDSVKLNVDKRHQLNVAAISVTNNKSFLESIHLSSKYSREEFQRHTDIEKDMYDLKIDSLAFQNTDYGFRNDSLKVLVDRALVKNADFQIYRDKTLPDDTSVKPMYSEMLRKMSFLLKLDTLQISNSRIAYEERMKADRKPGKVIFANLNATIVNLTNFTEKKEFPSTSISANADFMNEAPINLNWGFKVNNLSDYFNVSGSMGTLSARSINGFLEPGMNVKAEGAITSMRYDFFGNRNKATGGVNIAYKDFKIEVLKNDGTEKSGFLTSIANIFVNHNGESGKNANKGLEIERDKTKSFWNYLWSCIRKGALKTFV